MGKTLKILALETSDIQASVALSEGGETIALQAIPPETRSARFLAPTIREILSANRWKPNDVDAVAVGVGPGSFTGLRIGTTTAKMFAWAVGAKLIGVDVLETIASEIKALPIDSPNGAVVSIGIDAQRGDAAARRFWIATDGTSAPIALDPRFRVLSMKKWLEFEKEDGYSERFDWEKNADSSCFCDSDVFLSKIKPDEKRNVYFCGPALKRRQNKFDEIGVANFLDEKYWNPTAVGVAKVAWRRAVVGDFDDVFRLLPEYSRKATAEERAAGNNLIFGKTNEILNSRF